MRDYGKISWRVWRSQKFRQCTDSAQLTYMNLHTNPEGTSVGILTTTVAHIAADRCRPEAQIEADLQALHDCGLIIWDRSEELILITQFLNPLFNPITNGKHGKGAIRSLAHVKNDEIVASVLIQILQYEEKLFDEDVSEAKKTLSRLRRQKPQQNQQSVDTPIHTPMEALSEGYPHKTNTATATLTATGVSEGVSEKVQPIAHWVALGQKLLAMTGLDQAPRPVNTSIVSQWLSDWSEEQIIAGVQDVVGRGSYTVPSGLKYFENAIRKRVADTQIAEQAAWRANTASFDDDRWIELLTKWGRGERWLSTRHGPAPNETGCIVPERLLVRYRAKFGDMEPHPQQQS